MAANSHHSILLVPLLVMVAFLIGVFLLISRQVVVEGCRFDGEIDLELDVPIWSQKTFSRIQKLLKMQLGI